MLVEARGYQYEISKQRRITHEHFTRLYKLSRLEDNLIRVRRDLEQLPGNKRRRQREKISRLEIQIDALRLQIASEA